jgi:hypothetical protein
MPVPIFDEALAAQLLQTDACIIAEDGENVVVAVRLPKATIAGLMPFLAALADHTS